MLTLLLMAPLASAQDCNTATLKKDLADASPQGVANAFVALADCDAGAGKAAAAGAFERVLSGEGGNTLVIKAIEIGAGDEAKKWLTSLQSDERSSAVAALGAACGESDPVAGFLLSTHEQLGDAFWTDRWYRSLAECRRPDIQAMLQGAIDAGSDDRTRFFGVLEVYSRNLGAAAVPTLQGLAAELDSTGNTEELTYIVNAFADAAQVGSLDGQDAEATKLAIAAIQALAPELPPQALDQARTTLLSLGDEDASNRLSAYRHADQMINGELHYGLVAVETATCKKGDTWLGIHTGEIVEPGDLWPDQIQDAAEAAIEGQWSFELARKCKGTSEIEVLITEGPTGSPEGGTEWLDEQLEQIREREAKKVYEYTPPALSL